MTKAINKKPLVLWHQTEDDNFVELLKQEFGEKNVVSSLGQLENIDFGKKFDESSYNGIILPAELKWEGYYFTEFYGIELVRKTLRAEYSLRHPVLFLSFLPLTQLLNKKEKAALKRQIIDVVGHDYLQLPATPKQWLEQLKKMSPLTDLQFEDVFINQCNVRGLIVGVIHKLQGQFSELQPAPEKSRLKELFEVGIGEVVNLFDDVAALHEVQRYLLQRFEQIDVSSYQTLQDFLLECDKALQSFIIEDEISFAETNDEIEQRPWKVLLLDDEPNSLTPVREALKSSGVDCLIAETVEQAEAIIADDIFNEIVVVVSDYRLLEVVNGRERQQSRQGYDFLFDLAKSDRLVHLFALSGLSRRFLLKSFQNYNARVDVFSKRDLTGQEAVNIFRDTILDRGVETYDALLSRPLGGDWSKLKRFYAAYRKLADYRQRENQINEQVRHFIGELNYCLETGSRSKIEVLEELTADMDIKDPQNSVGMEIFQNKLTARRIALWLKQEGRTHEEIYAILKGYSSLALIIKEIEDKKNSNTTPRKEIKATKKNKTTKTALEDVKGRAKDLIITNLALRKEIMERALLVEERRWLKTEFDKDVGKNRFSIAVDISYLVQIGIEKFFDALPSVLEKLKASEETRKLFHKSKLFIVTPKEAKLILCEIGGAVSTKQEKQKYSDLLNVITKNIQAVLGEQRSADSFRYFLNQLSEAKKPRKFYEKMVLNRRVL